MPIVCLGVSHHLAPVSIRERLALDPVTWSSGLESDEARAWLRMHGIGEVAVLSTCNRTEIYAASAAGAGDAVDVATVRALLERLTGVPALSIASRLQERHGLDAVRHLCRVAAGLESMVLGESEILGQVASAHESATDAGLLGPVLDDAWRTALRAGRRARTETAICRLPASVASEAVDLLERSLGDLPSRRVALIGTGRMSRRVGAILRRAGVTRLHVVGRTTINAEQLADGIGAHSHPWHELESVLAQADGVITSTSAPHAVITRDLVAAARGGRTTPCIFVDTAVPRDVESAVSDLRGVVVHDLDALQQQVTEHLDLRREQVPMAERIIEDELAAWRSTRRAAVLRPLLSEVHSRAESIRGREVERVMRRLPAADDSFREALDLATRAVVAKLLDPPSRRLRHESDPSRVDSLAEAVRTLFDLPRDHASRDEDVA